MRIPVALVVTMCLGCSNALTPEDVAGVYVLRTVGNVALPAIVPTTGPDVIHMLADTLYLSPDGSGTHAYAFESEEVRNGSSVRTLHKNRRDVRFTTGSRVEITYICGPTENCTPGPHLIGQRSDGGLQLEVAGAPFRYALVIRWP